MVLLEKQVHLQKEVGAGRTVVRLGMHGSFGGGLTGC